MNEPTFTHGIFTFTLRPAVETDVAYILDTWLEGMASEYRDVRKSDYETQARLHILRILERGPGVAIASPVDEPSVIWAYIVVEGQAIHWCYVRRSHRRLGIARRLVTTVLPNTPAPLAISHITGVVRKIKQSHRDLFRFLPWLANPQGDEDGQPAGSEAEHEDRPSGDSGP